MSTPQGSLVVAGDYVYQALRKIGYMRPGYPVQAELLNDGLTEFSMLYDAFNAVRSSAPNTPDFIYPIPSNGSLQGIYGANIQWTIGLPWTFNCDLGVLNTAVAATDSITGLLVGESVAGYGLADGTYVQSLLNNGDGTTTITWNQNNMLPVIPTTVSVMPSFQGPRPTEIVRMNLWQTAQNGAQPTRIPLQPVTAEQFAALAVLQIPAVNVTSVFWYDASFPHAVINVFPPLNGNSLEIFTSGQFTAPTTLATVIQLPPGYQNPIVYALAERLWPMVPKSIMVNKKDLPTLKGEAYLAMQDARRLNRQISPLPSDYPSGIQHEAGFYDRFLTAIGIPY